MNTKKSWVSKIHQITGAINKMRRKCCLALLMLLLGCSIFTGCADKKAESDSDSGKAPVVTQEEETPDEEVEFEEQ